MNKKVLVCLFVIVVGILLVLSYYQESSGVYDDSNKTRLSVSGMNINSVDAFVRAVNSEDYYEGHDDDTVLWLLTLSGNYVFYSADYYVVMSKTDAEKLPVELATDVEITDIFDCEIVANMSLGEKFGDVLYVRNVEFIKRDVKSYEV